MGVVVNWGDEEDTVSGVVSEANLRGIGLTDGVPDLIVVRP